MNLSQAIAYGQKKLQDLENPRLETEVLLSALVNQNRTWLKTHPHQTLTWSQQLKYGYWLQRRRKHVPVAYITRQVEWNDLNLNVNRHTLIPRDETETLCHHIKDHYQTTKTPAPKSILDIGTGSGCLAIWLKTQFPQAQTTALDISRLALKVAQANAQNNQANISFRHSDLLQKIPNQSHFNLVVANLPYVPNSQIVSQEVEQEPATAIFSGDDGFIHLRRLAQQIQTKSISFNQLWLEFLPQQTEGIQQIFNHYQVEFFEGVDGQPWFAQVCPH